MAMNLISGKNIWLFPSFKNKGHISDRTVNYRSKHILHNNGIQVANRKNMSEVHACIACDMCLL